jgi:NAD(P)-dependent dehydrogenase (short-subunit alcohol dehydrogenase family)
MSNSLQGAVAFVTGGAKGIGKAAALRMAGAGVRVALMSRTAEDVERAVDEVGAAGGEALAVPGDVSDSGDVQRAIDRIVSTWGRLDVVFANAGVNGVWAPIEELSDEDWEQTVAINLTGTFYTVKYAVPHLKKRGGSIIITSSVNGTRMFSNTDASAYASTKAAQVAFAQMLAVELAPSRIRVNVICPGAIETDIEENTERRDLEKIQYPVKFPKGKIPLTHGEPGTPEQVADLVLFLASEASSLITGTPVWIDGAQSLLQG